MEFVPRLQRHQRHRQPITQRMMLQNLKDCGRIGPVTGNGLSKQSMLNGHNRRFANLTVLPFSFQVTLERNKPRDPYIIGLHCRLSYSQDLAHTFAPRDPFRHSLFTCSSGLPAPGWMFACLVSDCACEESSNIATTIQRLL